MTPVVERESQSAAQHFGEHATIDGYGGSYAALNDGQLVRSCLEALCAALGMQPLVPPVVAEAPDNQLRDPGGWSGFLIIAESHLSIHTFPRRRFGTSLHLVPHSVAVMLPGDRYCVEEAREHFDYIYQIDRYLTYAGGALKSRRNFLNAFTRLYPGYSAIEINLRDPCERAALARLWATWETNRGACIPNEAAAFRRFLAAADQFDVVATGILVDGALIAANVSVLLEDSHANGLFEKADTSFHGVYAALMHEVSKALCRRERQFLNYEQDLGIDGLRKSKMSFDPSGFLKKHSVSKR